MDDTPNLQRGEGKTMEFFVALIVIVLSLLACKRLGYHAISRTAALDDPKRQSSEQIGDERVRPTTPATGPAQWSTLDDLQLTRLLRDAKSR